LNVCTIIAKNYVAHARVLARSFAEHHPDGRFYVLVIDDFDGYITPDDEPFAVVSPGDLQIEPFKRMAALYDVLELCTAVKPWLLRWVLASSPDGIAVYLDPDMRIYAPLHELFALVHEHRLVLSPHNVDAMPRDGNHPDEQDILSAGAYNLGFLGIGSGAFAEELLQWWAERLENDCIVDSERGLFVDQRWIDLVPAMAPSFHLLRDRGFNVAYWNLASRPISRTAEGAWMAGDVPLRLFHFSGFDHDRPRTLSKHQDRIHVHEHLDLAQLCEDYACELSDAGAHEVMSWPYTYASTASGLPLTTDIRRAYRELLADVELDRSIYEPSGEAELIAQLNAPAAPRSGGEHGVTRYLASLHARHAHLRRAFPDLVGVDGPRYLQWVHSHSRGEVPEPLLPPPATTRARPQPSATPEAPASRARPFGVNVAGYLDAELDEGEVARQAIAALDAGGVPVLPVGIPARDIRRRHGLVHRGLWPGGFPINLVCVNADALPDFAAAVGPEFFKGRDTIGWWCWELSQFPGRWLGSLRHVDELWASSHFVADALAAVTSVPVTRVPMPVTVPSCPHSEPERFGLPPGFSFLFSYDYASALARKNPVGAIRAFLRAFPEPGEAILVLRSANAKDHPDDHARVRRAAGTHRHITVLDDDLEHVDNDRLIAGCDCYLSLHRSEGFGLDMAKAMVLGKPVIATGYSGNLDFMRADNSWLVDYKLVAVGPGIDPDVPDARWADPDTEHAAVLMREVFLEPQSAALRAQRGAHSIRRTHSPTTVGLQMAGLLRDIGTRLPESRGGWEDPPALALTRAADELLRAGSQPAPASAATGTRASLRRLVLRMMKPHITHQRRVDRALIDALESLRVHLRALTERGYEVEALTLLGLRELQRRVDDLNERIPEAGQGDQGPGQN